MKKGLTIGILVMLFIVGIFITAFPFISNYYYEHQQEKIIVDYQEHVETADDELLKEKRRKAIEYNEGLLIGNVVQRDPFDPEALEEINESYENLLHFADDGVIGYIKIPKINVNLAVYYGTSEEVLEKGIGHLENTSLPIGGKGTHGVMSGHTGLSDKKLFTDLPALEEGDMFFLYVLGETLAYQVDQIKIVEPHDTTDLRIDSQEDYITLVTCHPYGINSHRLLVRGTRIPYEEELVEENKEVLGSVESSWLKEYKKALILGICIIAFFLVFYQLMKRFIAFRKRRRRND